MSRNSQFYTQLPHEGLYGTQPIMGHHSTHQQPDHNQQQQQLHHWGSANQNHQVIWYHSSQEGMSSYEQQARPQQSVISDDEEVVEESGGRGGANEVEVEEEREHMFEKPLTPSDVGKLNRLVIPKQHAEKYLPLGGHDSLLSFEDESCKDWRFRYSYWNSSQSYVLTKGWSRFVKEKHLDAGDIVMFQRRRSNNERLLIRWRRRNSPTSTTAAEATPEFCSSQVVPNSNCNSNSSSSTTTSSTWTQADNFYHTSQQHQHHQQQQHHHLYPSHPSPLQHHNHRVPLLYQTHFLHAVGHNSDEAAVDEEMKLARAGGNSKKFRLFGVNLDLPN